MKKYSLILLVTILSLSLAGVTVAKGQPAGKGKLDVVINGGGIAVNENHGFGPITLLSVGGFSAKSYGDSAKGQIQSKSVNAEDTSDVWGSVHGSVVCVKNLGPNKNDDGFSGNVWEVRFQVAKGSFLGASLAGAYGSLFVLDGGRPGSGNDGIDEGFADPGSEFCGGDDADSYNLEPVVAGNFTVHE